MAVIEQPTVEVHNAGWFPDPHHQHNLRYFNGEKWTEHVTHYGPTPCHGCSYGELSSASS